MARVDEESKQAGGVNTESARSAPLFMQHNMLTHLF